jgi:energy-coupling factor transport system substrate-specific component
MKKLIGYLIILCYIAGVILMTYFNYNIDKVIILGAVFLIISVVILFEIKEIDSKTMTVLATLGALGGVFRIPFAAIPGLQPTTFIAAIAGYTLGPINGFMVGSSAAFISNFFLGQGPWTLWQMMGWGLCGLSFGLLRKIEKKDHFLHFVIFCFAWGYIYGFILDLWFVLEFIKPFSMKTWLAGFSSSFYFDSIHAFGNLIFTLIFGKKFILILSRYKKRFKIEYIE